MNSDIARKCLAVLIVALFFIGLAMGIRKPPAPPKTTELTTETLKNYKIGGDGRISMYSTVTIVDVHTGLMETVYSHLLHKFRDTTHSAKMMDGNLEVWDPTGVAAIVVGESLRMVLHAQTALVTKSGYVLEFETDPQYGPALNLAARGIEPPVLDNRPFLRVDSRLAGEVLMHFRLADSYLTFLQKDGTPVPNTMDTPLAFAKWGKKEPHSFANRFP